jgi:hypothetical protein
MDPPAQPAPLSNALGRLFRDDPHRCERWGARTDRVLSIVILLLVGLAIARAVAPIFADLQAFGGHDWDEHSAHRALTVKALREFGQLPLWMPYACGGFNEWANVQGSPNLVSPWFPFYWLLDLRHALRVEVVGTLLLSATGTWLWAGTFTKSPAARGFACLVFVANGRWALQAATGHTWHLYYAFMPWVFYAYERATVHGVGHGALRMLPPGHILLGGVALALMVYHGAIYPLPHTVLLLALYASARALAERSLRPILAGGLLGIAGFGWAAPKLVPMLIDFSSRPRPVDSHEVIDLRAFVELLVSRGQVPGSRPAYVPQWGWHEYGMYIGWVPVLVLGVGTYNARTLRERALRLAGLAALMLGFGDFHRYSPWALLHRVSLFQSQHVPTRWLYPALLCLGVVTAGVVGRALERPYFRRWIEAGLLVGIAALALDIGEQASRPLGYAFWMRPPVVSPAAEFHQEQKVPRELQYQRRDYAPEAWPAMAAGIGVIECTMHAALNIWAPKDQAGNIPGQGARGRGSPEYRGEAYTESGAGAARLVEFSPNRMVVEVTRAKVGDRVILNQNYDPGWMVDGASADRYRDAVAAPIRSPEQRLVFRFRPRGGMAGLIVLLLTAGVSVGLLRRYGWSGRRLTKCPEGAP